jgi:protein phosphatase-4 regulatory subunit 3
MSSLARIAEMIDAAGAGAGAAGLRDHVATQVLQQDYIPQLARLVRACEELDATDDLQRLAAVFKALLALNDSCVCDELFKAEHLMDVMGAMEYDPDVPGMSWPGPA